MKQSVEKKIIAGRILIAEDSLTQAAKLRFVLEQKGYKVHTVQNGKIAFEYLEKHKPSMVISDIVMPEMNGFELCSSIKSNGKYKDIPVILLTSLSEPEDMIKGLLSGADNFILKPYDEKYLLTRIEQIKENKKLYEQEDSKLGVKIFFGGLNHILTVNRVQILDLLLSTYDTAVQKNNELEKAKEELSKLNSQLEERVKERTLELLAENAERKKAEDNVRKLNEELEKRVVERTQQLEIANKELEAFSYSVSHDLRSPLRHINGFVSILQKENENTLTDKSAHYLSVIADSTRRLDKMIDDMLLFSRMGRVAVNKTPLNFNSLIEKTISEYSSQYSNKTFEWNIMKLPVVNAEFSLMHMVWSNLISNAMKYSSKKENPLIEIGFQVGENETIFYVQDNGAGFNMMYADKLFGVFQRLHTESEFEGNGIGLATVRRIVTRHGGRTWAKGEVDKGACFYFSLPNQ